MSASLFETEAPQRLVSRDYQRRNHDECFRVWDSGVLGALCRSATGSGKTPMACMLIESWLLRQGMVMVISYETQLVTQFAQEIYEFLGIEAGIEMDDQAIRPGHVPPVVVASRASLLRSKPPEPWQLEELKEEFGLTDLGACDKRACERILRRLRKGGDQDEARDFITAWNDRPEVQNGYYSRVHKFDWRYDWLLIFDEAHRHAHHLGSVGHIVDWFAQNPKSRRFGMTATPKRSDDVSIGHKMFPGVALDYPLYSTVKPCAVHDGWAVPYVQKYIQVGGVDFKNIKKIAGDFDDADLERVLGAEATLAKLIEPLLDLVGDRRTLIFSPGVEMAKNVAAYINARVPCRCPCGKVKWQPRKLVGDGAQCDCGKLVEPIWIIKHEDQAESLWGEVPDRERRDCYRRHQSGKFQFLSVCGLCREGYNDPDISCVAVFRPTSRKASSLAEQMKGRGCRPAKAIVRELNQCENAEDRLEMIRQSAKPDCLIVDLVGITGLADCASTIQIYSEGLPDEVRKKAEELLEAQGQRDGEGVNVEDVIEEARRQIEEEKERLRELAEANERYMREQAVKRAKANAQVQFSTHDVGYGSPFDPATATEKQMSFIARLGMNISGVTLTKKQAGRIISLLRLRKPPATVAAECWLPADCWQAKGPSVKQLGLMHWKGIPTDRAKTNYDASLLIEAKLKPEEYTGKRLDEIAKARNDDELTACGRDLSLVKPVLSPECWRHLVDAGRQRRAMLQPAKDAGPRF